MIFSVGTTNTPTIYPFLSSIDIVMSTCMPVKGYILGLVTFGDLLNSSVNVLTTFCKKPIYDTSKIFELVYTLNNHDYSCFVSSIDEYLEKLWICLENFEKILQKDSKYKMIDTRIATNKLCNRTKKRHAICEFAHLPTL